MSENTKIAWCDSTMNPWIGCTKVGPGCDNCYAKANFEDQKHRAVWGAGQARSRTKTWGDPVKWNKREFFQCNACGKRGFGVPYEDFNQATGGKLDDGHSCDACGSRDMEPTRQRVFCASLADVFDNEVDPAWRADLLHLIHETPNLDFLLLTKRIGNVAKMVDETQAMLAGIHAPLPWPLANVWLGATICNQEEADRDIPKLLAVPAAKRFLSMEPLLSPVDLRSAFAGHCPEHDFASGFCCERDHPGVQHLHWVIVGGESGPRARPIHPDWVRSLRDQCHAAGVAYFFKQWGEWVPMMGHVGGVSVHGPKFTHLDGTIMGNAGKKAAGRLLDGREWSEVPV